MIFVLTFVEYWYDELCLIISITFFGLDIFVAHCDATEQFEIIIKYAVVSSCTTTTETAVCDIYRYRRHSNSTSAVANGDFGEKSSDKNICEPGLESKK